MAVSITKQRRRERIRARPFPDEWLTILESNLPRYVRIPAEDQRELRETDIYPWLYSVIVYPHECVARQKKRNVLGVFDEAIQIRLGETAARGAVVLSWNGVQRGAGDNHDCHNVVFHEFAHQLDAETGSFDGAPVLPRRSMYIAWARILAGEFDALRERTLRRESSDIDSYGATHPAEFFAVVTECFSRSPIGSARVPRSCIGS